MTGVDEIRDAKFADQRAIHDLYSAAFPHEELRPLIVDLEAESSGVLSLLSTNGTGIVGHVMFTTCNLEGSTLKAALLGPLAVAPDAQRRGTGSSLVRDGLQRMACVGVSIVCVLGDPAYYRRFGFLPEERVKPPYSLPKEWIGAWQSLRTGASHLVPEGTLLVPKPWQRRELWAP